MSAAPRGREAVMRALLTAAAELFAKHGAAAVSVRDLARRAGVNHGLVHRHFGSKAALRTAVMDDLTERIAADLDDEPITAGQLPSAFVATESLGSYWRMLARGLLDGDDIDDIQGGGFPVVTRLLEQIREAQAQGLVSCHVDPRVITAASVALGLGWLLFEPFVMASTGLGDCDKAATRQRVFDLWIALVSGSAPSPA